MIFLINCSNLRQGGGIQVADSFCSYLNKYKEHHFIVVLSTAMKHTGDKIESYDNVELHYYDLGKSIKNTITLNDTYLDGLVSKKKCDAVLTVFGPSRWKPAVHHLCGFARAHILPMNTPYFDNLSWKERLVNYLVKKSFGRSAENYWTENPAVSDLLQKVFPKKKIFTVSNTYNQVFDDKKQWKQHLLPKYDGVSLLTVTNAYPHKNLNIALEILNEFRGTHPDFKIRFVFTIDEKEYQPVPSEFKDNFCFTGKVDITECPSLYEQSDIMFQPTLLECFTATYAEAMRMGVPIVTTNLSFARGLCGDAALYYSPMSAKEASEIIYKLANDTQLRDKLIAKGNEVLKGFDSSETRADKLVSLLESIVK